MGIIKSPERCHITDLPTENRLSEIDKEEYFVNFNGERYFFTFQRSHKNSELVEKNKYILKGLFYNGRLPFPENKFFDNEILEKILIEAQIPRTPKSKLDNLLLCLHDNQNHEGAVIDLNIFGERDLFLTKLYFINYDEYWFYLNTLKEQGLINFRDVSSKDGHDAFGLTLTFKGLEYVVNIQESGDHSKNCFIAMSFSASAFEKRRLIKKVVLESGYEPILVDELHYESELTINDAIIKSIKKSKFLIADFSEQKHGVYFEAGFALGLKIPVIYTCSSNDFANTHFDTNHYPHIVYDHLEDLERKLKDKIQAWIE